MGVQAEPATFAVAFGYLDAAYNKRREDVEVAFDMPDEQFGLCALGGAAEVCALCFFATGSIKSSVGGEKTVVVTQPAVSI
ncbi:hypothetical protein MRX96_054652 [Rhipicephalus microplus]